jgi:peroxiredoxin
MFLATGAKAGDSSPVQSKEIAVGDRAPLFTLKDQNDRKVSLKEMIQKGPVAVVFIRSVTWCTYCQLQTIQLSDNLEEIEAGGGQVVAICYDSPETIKRFSERRKIKVPILSDTDSKIIDAYDMRALTGTSDQVGSARHGTFVIDQSGVVRSKPYLTSFEGRSAVDALESALKEAGKPN